MNIENLFVIAYAAKNIGEYEIANDCFAVIAANVIDKRWREDGSNARFYYEYEYEDDIIAGLSSPMEEGYYDLLAVEIGDNYLCIPNPLVNSWLINKILAENLVTFIQRTEHRRERLVLSDEQLAEVIADLRRRLLEEVDEETIAQCRKMCLYSESSELV